MKCEVFGCQVNVYRRINIGPGTSTALCEEHFIEFKKELMPEDLEQRGEDMVQNNGVNKGVLEIKLSNVDIPNAVVLVDLLQEWVTWTKTYYAFLEGAGGLDELLQRTTGAVRKWGRDG